MMFAEGWLHLSSCHRALTRVTGKPLREPDVWSAEDVRRIGEAANWGLPPDFPESVGYWSARRFLEVCVDHGLGLVLSGVPELPP